jgi:hypothetical protein
VVESVRESWPVPRDARRIERDDGVLYVYPGFVDGEGFAEVSVPAPDRDGVRPWNPTREVQGFTPRRVAADHLEADGSDLAAYRRRGAVASLIFPGGGPMPGQVSFILHRPDARTARELVLSPSIGIAMSFQGARGAYPGTLFGVQALIRQGFLDAEHYTGRMEAYGSDAGGLEVDVWDEDLRILERARNGETQVFFRVHGAEDVRRVLALADEIGFRPVIVGGHEAGALAGELAARRVPVLLSLDFPQPDEWTPGGNGDEEELKPAAFREKRRLEAIFGTAAALHEAGVPFAFTSGGSEDTDLLAGVRRTVEYGLPEAAAVRALTLGPAELLGMPRLARVEEDVAANLVVADGPITEEGTRIIWTFVNGRAERGRDPRSDGPPDTGEPPAEVGGTWRVEVETEGMEISSTMTIEQDGTSFTGTMEIPEMGTARIVNGVIRGSSITFGIEMVGLGETLSASGTVEGGRMRGSGSGSEMVGPFTFAGTRTPGRRDRGGDR